MFDMKFKGIQIVTKFLNNSPKMLLELVVEYAQKVFFPLLTKNPKRVAS